MHAPETCAVDPDARDLRVFEAVRELLAVHGMRLSMEAIAAQAGCSKQTLYSRYGCKRQLLQHVVRLHVSATAAPLAARSQRPLREVLLEFAIGYLEHRNQPDVQRSARLIASSAHEFHEEACAVYRDGADALRDHMAEWMQTEIARGRLDRDDPRFMAELLISMIAGQDFERQRFHVPCRADASQRRRWAEFAIDRFLRAFAARPGAAPPTENNATRSCS